MDGETYHVFSFYQRKGDKKNQKTEGPRRVNPFFREAASLSPDLFSVEPQEDAVDVPFDVRQDTAAVARVVGESGGILVKVQSGRPPKFRRNRGAAVERDVPP